MPDPLIRAGADRGDGQPPGVPGWVKALGIALVALVLVMPVVMVTGIGGEHGPGRHG